MLQAQSWKVKCPPKLRHFMWQIITGCFSVNAKLNSRGIKCDTQCARCGLEETINHVLFECSPAFQTWALSTIPTAAGIFPVSSEFTNMDFLFWRMPHSFQDYRFLWILWYIWKAQNDKVFNGKDVDPHYILKNAEAEAMAWEQAQSAVSPILPLDGGSPYNPTLYTGLKCYTDGSWKDTDAFSGLGWYAFENNEAATMMGACNTRRSLSPLHSELDALLWAMQCMLHFQKLEVTFATDCSELVKMVSAPMEWPAFGVQLEALKNLQEKFTHFSLSLFPCANNSKADRLVNGARRIKSDISYVNTAPPVWISNWS